ncbi:MAG: hypothetical protein ACRD8Z_05035, partial [Nitrososphaeraceae archaeon]
MSQDVSSQPSVQNQKVNQQAAQSYQVSSDGTLTQHDPLSPLIVGHKQEEIPPQGAPIPGSEAEKQSLDRDESQITQQNKNVEEREANLPTSLEEARAQILALRQMSKERDRQYNKLEKQVGEITRERGYLKAMSLIPRELFRTEREYHEEATKVLELYLSKGIPEEEIMRIYKDRLIAKSFGSGGSGCSGGGGYGRNTS